MLRGNLDEVKLKLDL